MATGLHSLLPAEFLIQKHQPHAASSVTNDSDCSPNRPAPASSRRGESNNIPFTMPLNAERMVCSGAPLSSKPAVMMRYKQGTKSLLCQLLRARAERKLSEINHWSIHIPLKHLQVPTHHLLSAPGPSLGVWGMHSVSPGMSRQPSSFPTMEITYYLHLSSISWASNLHQAPFKRSKFVSSEGQGFANHSGEGNMCIRGCCPNVSYGRL